MRHLDINGARLAVETHGSGDQAIVLVHAGIADRRMWAPLIPLLPPDRTVVAYDMRGFGESEFLPGMYSDARDLTGLMDALGLENAAIVGASFGGRVALDVAANWPERVSGLALIDSAVRDHEPSETLREFGAAEDALVEAGDREGFVELNVRLWVDGPRQPSEVDPDVRSLVADMQGRAFDLQDGVEAEGEPHEVDLARISAPTVVVVGELDVPDFHAIARDLAAGIPNATGPEVVAGVTHLPALERPEETARLIAPVL